MMEATKELLQAVKDYREGKKEAFTALYEASNKYIYTCIRKVVGGDGNMQDAVSDIMQDTYVEISRSITQLDREERFLSWAGTIATRKCYAWVKKNRKYVLLSEEDGTFENLADDENMIPEEVMQDREKQRLVREIVEKQLTEMQKICIVAYYYNEQKQSEIAQELGIPENTVKTNLARAKAKIKTGVLELEKKQGTKLYSVVPLLLLLFREDIHACVVPKSIASGVNSAVAAAGGIGRKALLGKLASASVKAKVAAGVISVGVVTLIGSVVYISTQDKEESVQSSQQNVLAQTNQEQDSGTEKGEESDPAKDEEAEQANPAGEENETEPDAVQGPVEVTLSEEEQHDIEVLISLLTLNSYFFGGGMEEYQYPVDDMGMFVTMMNIVGSFSTLDAVYAKYLPQMEMNMDEYVGYSDVAEIQSYIKNVFGVENADLSAYSEGGKVMFLLYLDRQGSEVNIDSVMADADGVYEVSGNASVIEFGPTVYTFPYRLTVIKNADSVFGFQVLGLEYRETAGYGAEENPLWDIFLHPENHSEYYPPITYEYLCYALIDIDKDGKNEILLGSAEDMHPDFGLNWVTIFNILKYDGETVIDFDGSKVYAPLDADAWYYYDTGILMTRAEVGGVHTNFWNLLTGEFTDAAMWVADDGNAGPESEGHSKIYKEDGTEIGGEEGDRYYRSLCSGNETHIVWHEINDENLSELIAELEK